MTTEAEVVWAAGIVIIAILVWFNAAKIEQKTEQRERNANAKFNEIKQLIEKPGTTLEDVKKVIEVAARVSAASSMRVELKATTPDKEQSE
jgi:hypothetical protein